MGLYTHRQKESSRARGCFGPTHHLEMCVCVCVCLCVCVRECECECECACERVYMRAYMCVCLGGLLVLTGETATASRQYWRS